VPWFAFTKKVSLAIYLMPGFETTGGIYRSWAGSKGSRLLLEAVWHAMQFIKDALP